MSADLSADPQPSAVLDAAVDAIAQRVIDRIGVPKDEWEVAAQLEVGAVAVSRRPARERCHYRAGEPPDRAGA